MSIRDTSGQDRPVHSASHSDAPRRRTLLIASAAAAVVLILIYFLFSGWSGGSRSIDSSRVRIAQVTRGDLVRDIAADGRVIAANSPTLYAIAAGTVSLHVVAGDEVKAGTALAEIDSPELRSELAQAEVTLASVESEAGRAELDAQMARLTAKKLLNQAEVDLRAAQRTVERYQRGFDLGVVPKIDLATAQDELQKAEIGIDAAQQEYQLQSRGVGMDIQNKKLLADRQRAVVGELQRQVDALTLRAPFDGQVGQVQVAQRANVPANAPLLSVVDLTNFEVEIRVPESFARDLGIGMPAQITSGAGQAVPAQVSAVSPEVVNGEVTARLRFSDQQPPGLRQNQRLNARIVLDTRENVLMVDRGPFLEQGGGNRAWVMNGDVAVRRSIRTGVSSLNSVELIDGVREGERIVVSGSDQFGDAERVSLN